MTAFKVLLQTRLRITTSKVAWCENRMSLSRGEGRSASCKNSVPPAGGGEGSGIGVASCEKS